MHGLIELGLIFKDLILSENNPAMRVIFMSGYTEDSVLRPGVVSDNVLFIQKPFKPSDLLFKVNQAFSN